MNGSAKKRELSESESSWSSVEEIETKAITERDEEDEEDAREDQERSREEPRTRLPRRKSRSAVDHEAEIAEDREEAAQLRPLLTHSSA